MKNKKFFGHEKNLRYIIGFLLVFDLALSVIYPTVSSLFWKPALIPAVTVNLNGTTEFKDLMAPPIPTSLVFQGSLTDFIRLYLPFTLIGIFLIPTLTVPHIFLWIFSMISILFTIRYSSGIPTWRRVIYIYLTAVLIAGMGAQLWSTIGA